MAIKVSKGLVLLVPMMMALVFVMGLMFFHVPEHVSEVGAMKKEGFRRAQSKTNPIPLGQGASDESGTSLSVKESSAGNADLSSATINADIVFESDQHKEPIMTQPEVAAAKVEESVPVEVLEDDNREETLSMFAAVGKNLSDQLHAIDSVDAHPGMVQPPANDRLHDSYTAQPHTQSIDRHFHQEPVASKREAVNAVMTGAAHDPFQLLRRIHQKSYALDPGSGGSNGDAPPASVDIVHAFHRALRYGTVSTEPAPDSTTSALADAVQTLWETDSSYAYLEVSNRCLLKTSAYRISGLNPNMLSIVIKSASSADNDVDDLAVDDIPTASSETAYRAEGATGTDVVDKLLQPVVKEFKMSTSSSSSAACALADFATMPSNLFVTTTRQDDQFMDRDGPSISLHRSSPDRLHCIQSIDSLVDIADTMLPAEYETVLGKILCRCGVTFVSKSLPEEPFFAYWDTLSILLKAAAKRAPAACQVRVEWAHLVKLPYAAHVKYTHLIVRRIDNRTSTEAENTTPAGAPVSVQTFVDLDVHAEGMHQLSSMIVDFASDLYHAPDAVPTAPPTATPTLSPTDAASSSSRYSRYRSYGSYSGSSRLRGSQEAPDGSASSSGATVSSSTNTQPVNLYDEIRAIVLNGTDLHRVAKSEEAMPEFVAKKASSETTTTTTDGPGVSTQSAWAGTYNPLARYRETAFSVPISAPLSADSETSESQSTESMESSTNPDLTLSPTASPTYGKLEYMGHGRRLLGTTYTYGTSGSSSSSLSSSLGKSSYTSSSNQIVTVLSAHWDATGVRGVRSEDGADEFDVAAEAVDHSFLRNKSALAAFNRHTAPSRTSLFGDILSRAAQKLLQDREEAVYRRWMAILSVRRDPPVKGQRSSSTDPVILTGYQEILTSKLVYVIGRKVSLLTAKLALSSAEREVRRYKKEVKHSNDHGNDADRYKQSARNLIVSVLSDRSSLLAHEELMSTLLELKNNLLCASRMSFAQLGSLLAAPERAGVSIVQGDIVMRMVTLAASVSTSAQSHPLAHSLAFDLFEESVSAMLTLAKVSYLEVPSMELVAAILRINNPGFAEAFRARYTNMTIFMEKCVAKLPHSRSVKVEELRLAEYELIDNETYKTVTGRDSEFTKEQLRTTVFRVEAIGDPLLFEGTPAAAMSDRTRPTDLGASAYTLLHLGLTAQPRRQLLKLYIELPLWSVDAQRINSVVPWTLFMSLRGISEKTLSGHYVLSSDRGQSSLVSSSLGDYASTSDRERAKLLWHILSTELASHRGDLAGGKFSFVEHNSGYGYVSSRLAKRYPNATVVSIEEDILKVKYHVKYLESLSVENNAVCGKSPETNNEIAGNVYDSPEFFRYQLYSRGLLDSFERHRTVEGWGEEIGRTLSGAMTSFLMIPSSAQVSLAMYVCFGNVGHVDVSSISGGSGSGYQAAPTAYAGPYRALDSVFGELSSSVIHQSGRSRGNAVHDALERDLFGSYSLATHPKEAYKTFQARWLLGANHVQGGSTETIVTHLKHMDPGAPAGQAEHEVPLVRCDVVNMTRHVHHHYDYAKDGHKRTYTMRVEANETLSLSARTLLGTSSLSQAYSEQLQNNVRLNVGKKAYMVMPKMVRHKTLGINGTAKYVDVKEDTYEPAPQRVALGLNRTIEKDIRADGSTGIVLPKGAHMNNEHITTVNLMRDKDSWPIPYTSLYGITLITILRLGLEESQRDRFFQKYLKMPLYEDMAPWNIVMMGGNLDYIDYDTKAFTYDKDVPKAYMVSVCHPYVLLLLYAYIISSYFLEHADTSLCF
jgi:hypothetical protein